MTIVREAQEIQQHFANEQAHPSINPLANRTPLNEYQERIARHFQVAYGSSLPEPIESYDAFITELITQWRACIRHFDITFHDDDPTPIYYLNSKGVMSSEAMRSHVNETKALHVYRSDGSHSILDKRAVYYRGRWETMNSVFRAVHDLLGHCASGAGFNWKGETLAYYSHLATFTKEAQQALFSETVAQQCYYAYYGDYAPQIAVLYPESDMIPPLI